MRRQAVIVDKFNRVLKLKQNLVPPLGRLNLIQRSDIGHGPCTNRAVCLNHVPTIRGCGGQVVAVLASRVTLLHWLYARSANLYKQFNCVEGPILSGYHSGGLLVDLLIRNKLVVSLSW